ncbi:MAG: hypothetical protein AAF569_04480 [Pseudomonadota bacterium]
MNKTLKAVSDFAKAAAVFVLPLLPQTATAQSENVVIDTPDRLITTDANLIAACPQNVSEASDELIVEGCIRTSHNLMYGLSQRLVEYLESAVNTEDKNIFGFDSAFLTNTRIRVSQGEIIAGCNPSSLQGQNFSTLLDYALTTETYVTDCSESIDRGANYLGFIWEPSAIERILNTSDCLTSQATCNPNLPPFTFMEGNDIFILPPPVIPQATPSHSIIASIAMSCGTQYQTFDPAYGNRFTNETLNVPGMAAFSDISTSGLSGPACIRASLDSLTETYRLSVRPQLSSTVTTDAACIDAPARINEHIAGNATLITPDYTGPYYEMINVATECGNTLTRLIDSGAIADINDLTGTINFLQRHFGCWNNDGADYHPWSNANRRALCAQNQAQMTRAFP